jgi:hypothetical protein
MPAAGSFVVQTTGAVLTTGDGVLAGGEESAPAVLPTNSAAQELQEELWPVGLAAESIAMLIRTSDLRDGRADEPTRVSRASQAAAAPVPLALKAEVVDQVLREGTPLRRRLAAAADPTQADLLDAFAAPDPLVLRRVRSHLATHSP